MPENQQPKVVPKDSQSNTENEKPKRQRRTTRTRKTTAVSSDENDAPSETSNTKESSNEEVLSDITPSVTNNSIKVCYILSAATCMIKFFRISLCWYRY